MLRKVPYFIIVAEALICVSFVLAGGDVPDYFFQEGRAVTVLNALQLVVCGLIAFTIYKRSSTQSKFWLLISGGSIYLAVDEIMQFHETNGRLLEFLRSDMGFAIPNKLFTVGSFSLSTGDFVQLVYGVSALVVCYYFRKELLKNRKALAWFVAGAILLSVSAITDFGQFYSWLAGPSGINHMVLAIEDSFKFIGFGTILGGLFYLYLSDLGTF